MRYREATPADIPVLEKLLEDEKAESLALKLPGYTTWVAEEDGKILAFFTWRIDHEIFPHLFYFLVHPDKRDIAFFKDVLDVFRAMMRLKGYRKIIYHALKERPDLNTLLRWYTHRRPYSEDDNAFYYLMEA